MDKNNKIFSKKLLKKPLDAHISIFRKTCLLINYMFSRGIYYGYPKIQTLLAVR